MNEERVKRELDFILSVSPCSSQNNDKAGKEPEPKATVRKASEEAFPSWLCKCINKEDNVAAMLDTMDVCAIDNEAFLSMLKWVRDASRAYFLWDVLSA